MIQNQWTKSDVSDTIILLVSTGHVLDP